MLARVTEGCRAEVDDDDAPLERVGVSANDDNYRAYAYATNLEPASTLYEEFHPFGSSAYRAVDSTIGVSAKRYCHPCTAPRPRPQPAVRLTSDSHAVKEHGTARVARRFAGRGDGVVRSRAERRVL